MIAWRDDCFVDEGALSWPGAAARLGAGFFATVRWDGREARHYARHAARLLASLDHFGLPRLAPPNAEVAAEVARRNGLSGRVGRINLVYPLEGPELDAAPARPVLLAAAFAPPPPGPLALAVHPEPHASYLGAHKSTSYLPYLLARRGARRAGLFDAVLVDQDGLVVEASACALLLADAEGLVAPAHALALPSIALSLASEALPVRRHPVLAEELGGFAHAYVLNSLIGMRPVERIGPHAYEIDTAPCAAADAAIL